MKIKQWADFIKNNKILLTTYLIMLVIPLLFLLLSVMYTSQALKRESYQYQGAILEQASSICDNLLQQTELLLSTKSLDNEVQQLVNGNVWNGKRMFTVADMVEKLFNAKTTYPCVDSLGIYFYGNDSFVTDETRYPLQRQATYLGKYNMDKQQFLEQTQTYKGSFLTEGEQGNYLVLYQNSYNYSNKVQTATAYAIISCTRLKQELEYLDTLEGSSIFVIDQEGKLLCSTADAGEEDFSHIMERICAEQNGTGMFNFIDGTMQIFCRQSDDRQLYYGISLAEDSFYRRVHAFTFGCIGLFVLILLTGATMAIYFTRKTSAPIEHLLEIMQINRQKYEDVFPTENLKKLEEELLRMKQDNHQLTYQANSYDLKKLESVLQGIMEGLYSNEDWMQEFHEREPRLQYIADYRVVLFCFQNVQDSRFIQDQKGSQESYSLLFFALKNIIDEAFLHLAQEEQPGISLIMDDRVVCIVPVQTSREQEQEEQIRKEAETCIDFFKEALELDAYVAVSAQHSPWTELSKAYEEAEMTAAQITFWETTTQAAFYELENTREEHREGKELLNLKKQLTSCLIMNNYETAREVMNEIMEHSFSRDIRELSYNQCQAYGLISLLLDKMDDMELQRQLKTEYSQRLLHTHSFRELKEEMNYVFDSIIAYRKQNISEPEWIEQVKAYIQDNYNNPNLSISYIADRFSMTPSHVGSRFRKEVGVGILDYIHMLRLEECKKLLLQGKTIKYCADTVGYSDIKTLQRAFKRYEGMAPGQFRDEMNGINP